MEPWQNSGRSVYFHGMLYALRESAYAAQVYEISSRQQERVSALSPNGEFNTNIIIIN
jgi:hypothetical protein